MFERLGHGFTPILPGVHIGAVTAFSAIGLPAVPVKQREKLTDISELVDFNELLRPPGLPHGATQIGQNPTTLKPL